MCDTGKFLENCWGGAGGVFPCVYKRNNTHMYMNTTYACTYVYIYVWHWQISWELLGGLEVCSPVCMKGITHKCIWTSHMHAYIYMCVWYWQFSWELLGGLEECSHVYIIRWTTQLYMNTYIHIHLFIWIYHDMVSIVHLYHDEYIPHTKHVCTSVDGYGDGWVVMGMVMYWISPPPQGGKSNSIQVMWRPIHPTATSQPVPPP